MEGDGLRAEGEFLAFIWLVSRTTGESRVRQNSGCFRLLDFILERYLRVLSANSRGGEVFILCPGLN